MKTKNDAGADGETTANETPEPGLQLHCKVLVNGMVYDGSHHAEGKEMAIERSKAEYLEGMNPPQVAILGTV